MLRAGDCGQHQAVQLSLDNLLESHPTVTAQPHFATLRDSLLVLKLGLRTYPPFRFIMAPFTCVRGKNGLFAPAEAIRLQAGHESAGHLLSATPPALSTE